MPKKSLSGKVFLLITGASRGIGRQIAISFGSMLEEGSHVVLLATNLNGLKETAKNIPNNISVDTVSVDLSKATKEELESIIMTSLSQKNKEPQQFEKMVIVHNIGTMGNTSQAVDVATDITAWHNYFDLNVFIPAMLNNVLMKIFNEAKNVNKTVINITSLYALEPLKFATHYCTGKAAREMFFKVFALDNPEVDVLNYSPGPVETDMFHELCEKHSDDAIRKQFNEVVTNKTILTCEQTVNQLVNVLEAHKYTSGDHVDYYDQL
ncbi:sepiapterin reductase isoform X1 [Nomia melanderi]|uniref:sepiapterin reductase isoform X1 n=1 Tax=Nomia melanderi TaxID=2448451 RepID=UPI0013040251|nr:sepiapterin reductase-like [Nomia melanderi]